MASILSIIAGFPLPAAAQQLIVDHDRAFAGHGPVVRMLASPTPVSPAVLDRLATHPKVAATFGTHLAGCADLLARHVPAIATTPRRRRERLVQLTAHPNAEVEACARQLLDATPGTSLASARHREVAAAAFWGTRTSREWMVARFGSDLAYTLVQLMYTGRYGARLLDTFGRAVPRDPHHPVHAATAEALLAAATADPDPWTAPMLDLARQLRDTPRAALEHLWGAPTGRRPPDDAHLDADPDDAVHLLDRRPSGLAVAAPTAEQPLRAALAALLTSELGDGPQAWETFAALEAGWSGTLRELLDAVAVLAACPVASDASVNV